MEHVQQQSSDLASTNLKLQVEISERLKAEEQLMHDAMHDSLTGLPNRALFMDRLSQAIEHTRRRPDFLFSVLFLDLDSFKNVNDSLGHTSGDTLLMMISRRLKETVRSSDTVARLGGDEFVILCENTTDQEATEVISRKIQKQVCEPFLIHGHTVFVSASIGIVKGLANYSSSEEILRDADIAMYRAKTLGKARYEVFNEALRSQVVTRLQVESDLRMAIERNEFVLYYQPIVSLKNGVLSGFEALIRWNHPTHGLLLPKDFLQVAEETGLIVPIDHWVLQEACGQLVRWQEKSDEMKSLSMNVNISGKQFSDPNLIDTISKVLNYTGLPARSLKLEITESVIIDNQLVASQVFNRLVELGVQLEIDDFGTGYSSLSYLQNFPIHTIKIDKSFIQRIGDGGKSSELIRAIVSMAKEMGMETIAEGIETEEQLEEIQALMCKYGQGFLLASPMDFSSTEQFLSECNARFSPTP
jgi:diguanylate cyclase (GGDEF)-like protein